MIRKLIFLLLVSTASLCQNACSDEKKEQQASPPPEPPPLRVESITANKEKIPVWLEFTGKTEASKRIEVRARVEGVLEKVLFTEGALVEKGQKLFEIEKDSYLDALQQAKSKRDRDQATLDLAIADVKRYEPLVAEGLAPRATLEQYQAKKSELISVVEADEAAIRTAELNLSYTDVIAPIKGRISRLNVDPGNIVGGGEKTLLTTLVSDDPMYSYFNPAEEGFQFMRKYASREILNAIVRVPSKTEYIERGPFKGYVNFSDNRVDPMTSTITMRATVENPDHDLMEGTFVYVDVFVTDKHAFMAIPSQAILDDQLGSYLFAVDEAGKAKRIDVVRGYESRHFVVIEEGLTDGDRIIISALTSIKPGLKVDAKDVSNEKGVLASLKKEQMAKEEK